MIEIIQLFLEYLLGGGGAVVSCGLIFKGMDGQILQGSAIM
jgi:hypothetical protein